jgi:hypothetical protein
MFIDTFYGKNIFIIFYFFLDKQKRLGYTYIKVKEDRMDKMVAIIEMAALRRELAQAKQIDALQNEGGEGFETSVAISAKIDNLMFRLSDAKLCFVNGKIHDESDWQIVRSAWNDAIKANMSKGQGPMLVAAKTATGYEADHIMYLKKFFS